MFLKVETVTVSSVPASHLVGNPDFLGGEFSVLELLNVKLVELDPVVSVLTVGLNIGNNINTVLMGFDAVFSVSSGLPLAEVMKYYFQGTRGENTRKTGRRHRRETNVN